MLMPCSIISPMHAYILFSLRLFHFLTSFCKFFDILFSRYILLMLSCFLVLPFLHCSLLHSHFSESFHLFDFSYENLYFFSSRIIVFRTSRLLLNTFFCPRYNYPSLFVFFILRHIGFLFLVFSIFHSSFPCFIVFVSYVFVFRLIVSLCSLLSCLPYYNVFTWCWLLIFLARSFSSYRLLVFTSTHFLIIMIPRFVVP